MLCDHFTSCNVNGVDGTSLNATGYASAAHKDLAGNNVLRLHFFHRQIRATLDPGRISHAKGRVIGCREEVGAALNVRASCRNCPSAVDFTHRVGLQALGGIIFQGFASFRVDALGPGQLRHILSGLDIGSIVAV